MTPGHLLYVLQHIQVGNVRKDDPTSDNIVAEKSVIHHVLRPQRTTGPDRKCVTWLPQHPNLAASGPDTDMQLASALPLPCTVLSSVATDSGQSACVRALATTAEVEECWISWEGIWRQSTVLILCYLYSSFTISGSVYATF